MYNQILLSDVAEEMCFTSSEWYSLAAQINGDMYTALLTGLIIGAVVGAAGLYLGLWWNGKNRR
jgi:hypothetical protein